MWREEPEIEKGCGNEPGTDRVGGKINQNVRKGQPCLSKTTTMPCCDSGHVSNSEKGGERGGVSTRVSQNVVSGHSLSDCPHFQQ